MDKFKPQTTICLFVVIVIPQLALTLQSARSFLGTNLARCWEKVGPTTQLLEESRKN